MPQHDDHGVNANSAGRHLWPLVFGGFVLLLIIGLAVCEALGWPFLAGPMQHAMARALDRTVVLSAAREGNSAVRIHLLGSVRVRADTIEIGPPSWSRDPYTVRAENAELALGYADLWRIYRGGTLHVRELAAHRLDLKLERLGDGRASWHFGSRTAQPASTQAHWPSFGMLRVDDGTLRLQDAIEPADLEARFALNEGSNEAAWAGPVQTASDKRAGSTSAPALSVSAAASAASVAAQAASQAASSAAVHAAVKAGAGVPSANAPTVAASNATATASEAASAVAPTSLVAGAPGLQLQATGHYRNLPLQVDLHAAGVTGLLAQGSGLKAQPVELKARLGHSMLSFSGEITNPLHMQAVRGRIDLAGPSLAAIGDPVGVTLPTTPAFATHGYVTKDGNLWTARFDEATIGSSRVRGAFTYDRGRPVPLLSGRLEGSRLALADLGPAIGTPAPRNEAGETSRTRRPADAKVLPERPFDLPSLRKMDANVAVDVDSFDLGTSLLEPLRPLRAHLRLKDGTLTLSDLDARTAGGRLEGNLQLDGRAPEAVWTADLRLLDVHLQSWIEQQRGKGQLPYLAGRLDTQMKVTGKGRSTAEILGSLDGTVRLHIRDGRVSHFAVEVAGIDVANALGLVITGDNVLPIQCNVADWNVERGLARAHVFVLDTKVSTIWVTGGVSFGTETIDLIAYVSPKEFSPFTLRSPIHVSGSFAHPSVSVEASKIGAKVGAAALLSLLNPLAAVIPFLDPGAKANARHEATQCQTVVQRVKNSLTKPAQARTKPD